jgi:hypothetical protein
MSECPICHGEVRQRHNHGPVPRYCGPGCRKRAERKRLQHLARLGAAVERALHESL